MKSSIRNNSPRLPILLLLLASACLPHGQAISPESAVRSWRSFEERWATVHTMSGFYRVRLEGPSTARPFSANVVFAKPGKFYMEATDFFGRPRFILTVTPERVTALLPGNRLFFEGRGGPRAMERLFSVPLGARVLLPLLTGEFIPAHFQPERIAPDSQRRIVVEGSATTHGAHYRFVLDARASAVLSGQITLADGPDPLTVNYSHFIHADSHVVPGTVRLMLRNSSRLTLRVIELKFNQQFEDDIFTPIAPPGFRHLPLEELEATLSLAGARE